jgi:hypothetical protein
MVLIQNYKMIVIVHKINDYELQSACGYDPGGRQQRESTKQGLADVQSSVTQIPVRRAPFGSLHLLK